MRPYVQPTTCPLLLARYIARARSIDAFNSSLCQSPSVSLIQPVVVASAEAENKSGEGIKLEDPGNVEIGGAAYAGGPEREGSPNPPRTV